MRIPFDVKFKPQIESGEYKVETRDCRPVCITCWEAEAINPKEFKGIKILAYHTNSDTKLQFGYNENGKFRGSPDEDLFIVTPEEELSEFEKGCIRLYQDGRDDGFAGDNLSDEILKESAAELLELAKKEIAKGHEHDVYIPEDIYYEQLKKQWEEGYDKGKSKALKDLPRWISDWKTSMVDKPDIIGQYLYYKEHKIRISDLEKLPGFKEDE